jgi:hypothetical protein
MKVAFICGPYRADTIHGIVQNIRKAEYYAKKYWQKGYCVICPHKNTALFDGVCQNAVWLNGAKELLSRADILVLIPGWQNSSGSMDEWKLAKELEKEILEEKE